MGVSWRLEPFLSDTYTVKNLTSLFAPVWFRNVLKPYFLVNIFQKKYCKEQKKV